MGNQVFSTRIRDLREKAGLSMEQLAKRLGITKSRISMWENCGTVPRMNILVTLARFFNVSTDYLLGNDDEASLSKLSPRLSTLQRNLGKLSEADLIKAEEMLKAAFMDIFNDDEDEDDNI